jgi:hypothetical protein
MGEQAVSKKLRLVTLCVAVAGGGLLAAGDSAYAQVLTKSFQNGANGYAGSFDRKISMTAANEQNGANVAQYFMDGYAADGTSPDEQNLIRFDNLIGNAAGQIPANATILSAKLTVTTSLSGNSQTNGPFGVAGLNQAFDATTSYFTNFTSTAPDFSSRGAWWQDGSATRPVGGYGFQIPGVEDSANIHPLVQGWANGTPNHGLVIQAGMADLATQNAGTADGWSIHTTGFPFSDTRPKLQVSYTTAPVTKKTFQQNVGGYTGGTMAIVRSGLNALVEDTADPTRPEITEDGAALEQTFLDGVLFTNQDGTTSSGDDFALLKFGGVFAAGQAPANVPVAKAWVVLTTSESSVDARTSGPFSAHKMLRPWDTTTLHSSFGAVDGLQVGDGDIGPSLETLDGFIRGSEAWFDVTSYMEGVRTGAADNGVAVIASGTADGWQIFANGSATEAVRPKLIVYSADLGVTGPGPGDFNDDGAVDGADFLVWQRGVGTTFDAADLADWKANFGTTGGGPLVGAAGAAVPEPTMAVLSAAAALGLLATSRRATSRS